MAAAGLPIIGSLIDDIKGCFGGKRSSGSTYLFEKEILLSGAVALTAGTLVYGIRTYGPLPSVVIGSIIMGALVAGIGMMIICSMEGGGTLGVLKCLIGDVTEMFVTSFSSVTGIPLDKVESDVEGVLQGVFSDFCPADAPDASTSSKTN